MKAERTPPEEGRRPRSGPSVRRVLSGLLAGALLLGACSSSKPTTTTTTVHLSAAAQISSNWLTFFSGQTAAAKKIAVLQNGSAFAQIIDGQATSALAKSVHATVAKVSDITASSARVKYSIYLGTSLALGNQLGEAVFQSGKWKVSDASFCVLLGLEQVSSAACPKA